MKRLYIWNERSVKNKISICVHEGKSGCHEEELFPFPLPDILCSFYKTVSIAQDFYSRESFEGLLTQYKAENKGFAESAEGLTAKGWISFTLGHWKCALTNLHAWEEAERIDKEEFADAAVIRFLIWLKRREREEKFAVEIADPEGILEKWRAVCDKVPDLDWFTDQHYLEPLNGKYYAGYGRYAGGREIDQALAKLWLEWGKNRREDWMTVALLLEGSYKIGGYLEEAAQEELIHFILDDYVYRYAIPSREEENRFYRKLCMAESPAYCKEPDRYDKIELWGGNRVIDLLDYEQYGYEHYRWDAVRQWEYTFLIASCAVYARWRKDGQDKKFADYLNSYDKISTLYYTWRLDADAIYELLTESGTFFVGFRYLVRNIGNTALEPDVYAECVGSIVDAIFEQGIREKDFFKSEDIGSCLFYLIMRWRFQKNVWEKFFRTVVSVIGKEKYLDAVAGELCSYFRGLLEIKRDVNWAAGYQMILFCVDQWFLENPGAQEKEYYRSFMDIVWDGCRIALDGKSDYITFLREEYFSERLCSELYRLYMREESAAGKRKLLLPADRVQYQESDNRIYHFYKLLLTIIYHIYENNKDASVKGIMFEVLEKVLIEKNRGGERTVFDYSYMQIFSAEAVICKCVGLLEYGQGDSAYLLKNLLEADVPELLIYYGAVQDQRLKEEIRQKIDKKAAETSLEVCDSSHALDLVMDFQIESLYPAVEYTVEKKLKRWEKKNLKREYDYQHALHQQCRLKYCKKEYRDILEGDNVFFKAIVYMETEEYRDYGKADRLWKSMIVRRERHNYASTVYLNYLSLLNRELDLAMRDQMSEREKILENISWLTEIVEKEQIRKWKMDDKEAFGWLVVQSRKICGGDYLRDFYSYKEKYHLKMSIEEFCSGRELGREPFQQNVYDTVSAKNVVEALRIFAALDRMPKAETYYRMRGYQGVEGKDWGTVMLTEQVLKTCVALQNYGSQLIYAEKEIVVREHEKEKFEVKVVEKLYEDGVTMLFRELFNLAFEEFYSFTVHDQEKRGSTGNYFGGRKSSAEIDLSVYYKGKCCEIMEAFVLKDNTAKTVFKDHMGKAIGNNINHQPLTFMLIYGNAQNSGGAWSKYENYMQNELSHDFDGGLEQTSIPALDEAPYFLKEFKSMYPGLVFLRQSIRLKSGTTQEILHIYIDIAKNLEGEIRRGGR